MFLTYFHHKWRTDAGHSKTTVQENNDKNWNKKKILATTHIDYSTNYDRLEMSAMVNLAT